MPHSFQYFGNLPAELQMEIWNDAVRPAKPGIQIFSLSSGCEDGSPEHDAKVSWADTCHLTAPKWAFGPKPDCPIPPEQLKAMAVCATNNPSTYVTDWGLWDTCRQSRRTMTDKLSPYEPVTIQMRRDCGIANEVTGSKDSLSHRRRIIVSPSHDLFILQLDDSDMFGWTLFDDIIPVGTAPVPLQIRNVGWEYETNWAASLHELKRKHWVPSRKELDRVEAKAFEADSFRLTEVMIDDVVHGDRQLEQLPWGEVEDMGGSGTLGEFVAFVCQLRRLVTDTLEPTPTLGIGKGTAGVKVLAYEDRW
ncbi:uncharacterized protein FTJAE_10568 [Fusarium tjaetaba]|uniref:2EXR domain-containing protein n=1 Tax=Fusarium tjaetaba TaxID=1567544 RepID=A0A8H5QWM1_9HYPO|nr:uncharacterized protein FTJAE_10568 [Fusarium tjaetaba]KAF5623636.1 hypothetical protein FTJAE_10568 [Fusarium tjaetaba]